MLNIEAQKFKEKYQRLGLKVSAGTFATEGINSRYGIINDESDLPNLAFIHGAPGYLDEFRKYYLKPELHRKFRILALERPGYGASQPGQAITSIAQQALHLGNVIKHISSQPCFLLGHSFGGPICCKITAEFPGIIKGLILLAPALDPESELNFWTAHLVKTKIKPLIPTPLQMAAYEKLAHRSALTEIVPSYSQITGPIWYFHGKQDIIVPFANLQYAKNQCKNADLKIFPLPFRNHFINLFPPPEVIKILCSLAGM